MIIKYFYHYENHYLNMEADGEALEKYIKNNERFKTWDVLVVDSRNSEGITVGDQTIHPTPRPFSKKSGVLSVYGGKMRIGTMGLTKHGLTEKRAGEAEEDFRELKRPEYELKYKEEADEKLKKISIPDRAYLIPDRNPILIIHYLIPTFEKEADIPVGFVCGQDYMVGYGIGFPSLAGSEPVYAVYYINTVEQRQAFAEEIEEDQFDDNED